MPDYDELWDQYANEFNAKLEITNNGDWNKLDEEEQEIAALWKLTADMYSSGFEDFFLSWGYECYSYAMRGIQRMIDANMEEDEEDEETESDLTDVYTLFDDAYTEIFSPFENDDRIKSYEDIGQYLTQTDEDTLEEVFAEFDEDLGPILCKKAYKFYCEKLNKKP